MNDSADKAPHETLSRLLDAAKDKGVIGPSALADALGESAQTVTNWARRGVSKSGALKAQERFGVSATWIASGTGAKWPSSSAEASNVEPGPDMKGLVPVISWVQAGDWQGTSNPLHPGEAEEWLQSPTRCSPNSYALRVRGDSMTATHGNSRSYPEGSIIFVDPERRMPVNGDRIIAKLPHSDEVTFKVYKNEDGRQWLQPLNPTHEPIREPFKVLGTIVGTWIPE